MSSSTSSAQRDLEQDLELFAPSRSRGGASKALREHLANVEGELGDLRADIQELEEAILEEPHRPIEEILYPRNELGSQRGEIRRGVASQARPGKSSARGQLNRRGARGRQSGLAAWRERLGGLPWGQICGLVALVVAVVVLIRIIW